MSFIFVSHADADKLRIKPITDRLIQSRWRLFIDRPDAMLYTSTEIRGSIGRIIEGQNWSSSIDDAILEASCILLFASRHLLQTSKNRSVLKREVLVGDIHRKLVTVRIDDFDLAELGPDFPLTRNQYLDLFLPHGEGPSLDRKIERLNEAVEEKFAQARILKKGRFQAQSTLVKLQSPPTVDLIDHFVMMLDREAETSSFCLSSSRLSIVHAFDSARPWYFKRRLAERELPRTALCNPGSHEVEAQICENRWDRKRFNWVACPERSEGSDKRAAVEQIVRAFPELPLPSVLASDQECIQALLKRLCADRKPVLLTTFIRDESRLRNRNAYLIRSLAELLQQVPEERCRLLIRVEPASKSRPATGTWLKKLTSDAGIGEPIALGEVRKEDLYTWCDFMERYVERTALNVLDSISEIFGGESQMTFEELESKVKPVLQTWQLKPQYHRAPFFG